MVLFLLVNLGVLLFLLMLGGAVLKGVFAVLENSAIARIVVIILVVAGMAIAISRNGSGEEAAALRDDAYFTRTAERGPDLVEWEPVSVVPVVDRDSEQCAEIFSAEIPPTVTNIEFETEEVLRMTVAIPSDCEPTIRPIVRWSNTFIDSSNSRGFNREFASEPGASNSEETVYVVGVPDQTGYLAIKFQSTWMTFVLLDP